MIDRTLNYGRPLIRKFLQQIPAYQSVLDIGAGTGVDLSLAQEVSPAAAIHAIEVHPPYAGNLRKKGWTVHPINIEKDRFPFDDESLDVVMANQVLEHVKEIFWIFHETSRALKTGGHLIVGVPNLASLHNRILLALGLQPTAIHLHSAHVRGYTRRGLIKFLNEAAPGLYRVEKWGGSNFYPFPGFIAKPLAALLPGMAWGCFFLLKKVRPYKRDFVEYASPGRLETNYYVGTPNSSP